MYELTVISSFSSAHFLRKYPGACANLHGHNWKVHLTVQSFEVDENGMVIDLYDLKNHLDTVLKNFDHKIINDTKPFDRLNPTSENLAKFISDQIGLVLPKKINVSKVKLFETDDFAVSYLPSLK